MGEAGFELLGPAAEAVVEEGGGFAERVEGVAQVAPELVAQVEGGAEVRDGGLDERGGGRGIEVLGAPREGVFEG